jgi:hypothetical protein
MAEQAVNLSFEGRSRRIMIRKPAFSAGEQLRLQTIESTAWGDEGIDQPPWWLI